MDEIRNYEMKFTSTMELIRQSGDTLIPVSRWDETRIYEEMIEIQPKYHKNNHCNILRK